MIPVGLSEHSQSSLNDLNSSEVNLPKRDLRGRNTSLTNHCETLLSDLVDSNNINPANASSQTILKIIKMI